MILYKNTYSNPIQGQNCSLPCAFFIGGLCCYVDGSITSNFDRIDKPDKRLT